MRPAPAFQFYAADFLVGTMGMSDEDVGVYIKMLAFQWDRGALPSDPKAIKSTVNCKRIPSENVMKKFTIGEDGFLRNARLERERQKVISFKESRADNAKKRWEKPCTSNARADSSICINDALHTSSSSSSSSSKLPLVAKEEVVAFWNSRAELPKVQSLTTGRSKHLKSRVSDAFFLTNWKAAVHKIIESPFLTGTNDRGWVADFDWFIKPDSVPRIMEGKYDHKTPVKASSHANGYNESTDISHL